MLQNRVKESFTTTGTGTISLLGAVSGFRTFLATFSSGKAYYVLDNGTEWEVGIGTVSGSTLTRDTVLSSSNAGSLVNFSAGTKYAYCDLPADFLNPSLKVDTDGATVTFDLLYQNVHQVTLGGNRTLALSNAKVGQRFLIRLVQDATGGRTVTWFTTIKWQTVPTLSTGANKVDVFGFLCTGAGTYDGFICGQNL